MVFRLRIGSGSRFRDWRNPPRIPTTTFSPPRLDPKGRSLRSLALKHALREIGGTFEGQLLRRGGSRPYEPSVVTENAVWWLVTPASA
jgi:hypothetical protein